MTYDLVLDFSTVATRVTGSPQDAEAECLRLVSTVSGRHAKAVNCETGFEVARADFDSRTGQVTSKAVVR